MENIDFVSLMPVLIIGFVLLIIVLVILRRIFVNVGAREIAIKERRYFGKRMPPGRVVATEGEVGIQADVLKPGLHLIKFPFEKIVRKVPLIEIGADELGVVEAIDGEPMLPGRIFALDRAQNAHNNFQDPIAFIKQGGVKGIQLRTLPPGLWPIHPYLFRISVAKTTVIPQDAPDIIKNIEEMTYEIIWVILMPEFPLPTIWPSKPSVIASKKIEGRRSKSNLDRAARQAADPG